MRTSHRDGDQDNATKERAIRMKCVAFDTRLSSTAIRLAAVIYYGCLDEVSGTSEYGQKALAKAIGAKVKTVQNAVRELEDAGHVHVDRYKGKGGTNLITWLPATQDAAQRMRFAVKAVDEEERADQEARAKARAQVGKKIPVEDNGNRNNFTGTDAASERSTGKNIPVERSGSLGRNLPTEAAQSVKNCRQSYIGRDPATGDCDLNKRPYEYWF